MKNFNRKLPLLFAFALLLSLVISGCQVDQGEGASAAPDVTGSSESGQPEGASATPDVTESSESEQPEADPYASLAEERAAMLERLHLDLPDSIAAGQYDLYFKGIGFGGYPLLDAQGQSCGGVAMYTAEELKPTFGEDGSLVSVWYTGNHASFSEFEPVETGEIPCVIAEFSSDVLDGETNEYLGTHEQWYAVWAVEDSQPIYALFADQEAMSYEEFKEIAASAVFAEGAFS